MAQVTYNYSAMNAGKSTSLLQSSYNYNERGMNTLLLTPAIDRRSGSGKIASRIGLEADAVAFEADTDLWQLSCQTHADKPIAAVLIDECQFLSHQQVQQLCQVADELEVPVLAYGLRTDFLGNLFEGSAALLAWADQIFELQTMCHCGKKATMNLRLDAHGKAIQHGSQIEIGGNERYTSLCRKHYLAALRT